jgi:hypothetical protein
VNWDKNIAIEKASGDSTGLSTILRSQWGYGDDEAKTQLESILAGDTLLLTGYGEREAETVLGPDGQRIVVLNGYRDDMTTAELLTQGVALGYEAYRDGIVTDDNYLETRDAAWGHTEMALRMIQDGQDLAINDNLARDLVAYLTTGGDRDKFDAYVDENYDSSGDFWKLIVRKPSEGGLDISVQKDQETDTLADLAIRLAGGGPLTPQMMDMYIGVITRGGGNADLQLGDILSLTGIIAQNMNFLEAGTALFQNSGLPQFLDERYPGVGYTDVRLHRFNIPPASNSNAWPNNTIGVGSDNYVSWMATLNTLSIAKQYGFNLEEDNSGLAPGIRYILHENMHLAQFDQIGTLPFVIRYIPEVLGVFGANYDADYTRSQQLSYENILASPAGMFGVIPSSGSAKPQRAYTTLDTRADAFAYWGV